MTAIERIFEFAELPSEAPLEIEGDVASVLGGDVIMNSSAVSAGIIEFKGVSLKYDPEGSHVLHDLTFCTEPGEKIGVVGRTGAGKSTILQVCSFLILIYISASIYM